MEFLLVAAAIYLVMAFGAAVLAGRFVAAGEDRRVERRFDATTAPPPSR